VFWVFCVSNSVALVFVNILLRGPFICFVLWFCVALLLICCLCYLFDFNLGLFGLWLTAVASAVFAVLWWRLFCFALFVLVFGGLLVIILFCVFAAVGLCVILLGFGWFVNLGGIGFVVVVYCLGFGTCG